MIIKTQNTALQMQSDWLSKDQLQHYIQYPYRMGFVILGIKRTKKYLFFGPSRYKVTLVCTYEAFEYRKNRIISSTEDYEVLRDIDNCMNAMKQAEPIQIS